MAHTEDCCKCHRNMVHDSNRDLWFWEDDYEIYGFRFLGAGAALHPFKTDLGRCCSIDCWNDYAESDDDIILPGKPYLVRRSA